mmetsp:Transcript_125499/g.287494  ORF Transcript_125499/g.287494 Transcript_125499/m.287494 type:complete len:272 (-) Transcript_125499:1267-2082(-)
MVHMRHANPSLSMDLEFAARCAWNRARSKKPCTFTTSISCSSFGTSRNSLSEMQSTTTVPLRRWESCPSSSSSLNPEEADSSPSDSPEAPPGFTGVGATCCAQRCTSLPSPFSSRASNNSLCIDRHRMASMSSSVSLTATPGPFLSPTACAIEPSASWIVTRFFSAAATSRAGRSPPRKSSRSPSMRSGSDGVRGLCSTQRRKAVEIQPATGSRMLTRSSSSPSSFLINCLSPPRTIFVPSGRRQTSGWESPGPLRTRSSRKHSSSRMSSS